MLTLECWEEDTFSNSYIGMVTMSLGELANGEKVRSTSRQVFGFVFVAISIILVDRLLHGRSKCDCEMRFGVAGCC